MIMESSEIERYRYDLWGNSGAPLCLHNLAPLRADIDLQRHGPVLFLSCAPWVPIWLKKPLSAVVVRPIGTNGEEEKMTLPFPEVSGASVSELNAMPLSPSQIHYPCSDPPHLGPPPQRLLGSVWCLWLLRLWIVTKFWVEACGLLVCYDNGGVQTHSFQNSDTLGRASPILSKPRPGLV
jgi:hypothetical protein